MECKNCLKSLRTDFMYCPDCGGKVIHHRITAKSLTFDVFERYFNLDNRFLKTFIHLFTKPKKVIEGYLSGVRKQYLNPIGYLGIALTLSSILMFIIKDFYPESMDFTRGREDMNTEFAKKWANLVFDYNSFFFLLYFPALALPAYLLLNKKKYNFAELIVAFIYIMSQYSILMFPITIGLLLISPLSYLSMTQPLVIVTFFYVLYVLQQLNGYSVKPLLWRSIVYSILATILFLILIMAIIILMMIGGVFTLEDLSPQI